eukprot:g1437.t1
MSVTFVAPQAPSDLSFPSTGKSAFVSGDGTDASVNHALTSMAAMFVVVGGVRWRERRQRVTLRRAGGGPSTAVELVDKSEYLRDQHWTKTFHAGFMGGAYVGMAGLLSLVIGGNMASQFITQKAVFAALFPINLLLVLTTGGQLFTGNSATMAIGDLLRNWAISYVANICGCLLIDAVARYTGMFTGGAQEPPLWDGRRGEATDLSGKMVGVWFPISMFIAIGFEHSVANMFILPAGIFSGAPLSWGDILVKNLIPVTIGNAIAGAFVVGAGMSFMFGKLGKKEDNLFCVAMSVAFVAPQASLAKLEATSDYTRYQNRGKNAFVSGYDGSDASVNHALTSMAAMFVVVGGVRWRERRQRVTLRRAGGGPSTAVVGSPQEPLSGCGVSGFGLSIQLRVIDET